MKAFIAGNLKSKTNWAAVLMAIVGVLRDSFPEILALLPAGSNAYLIAAALMIVMRNVTKTSIEQKGGSQGGFAHSGMLVLLAAIATVLLAGCATNGGSSATEKLVVQAATMKFIEASGDRAAKAARIAKAADQARVWLDTDGVTIGDLHTAMIERIAAADLEPSDKLLASALVDVVVAELNVRIGDGIISAENRATVNAVLAWVEQAASFYST